MRTHAAALIDTGRVISHDAKRVEPTASDVDLGGWQCEVYEHCGLVSGGGAGSERFVYRTRT